MAKISKRELEDKIWAVEGIRVAIDAPRDAQFSDYKYKNAVAENTSVTKFIAGRLEPVLNGATLSIYQGDGEEPHGRTAVKKVRASYSK